MITVLHTIREAVEQYGTEASPKSGEVLVAACTQLFNNLGYAQREYQTHEMVQIGINQCYALLVNILNSAWVMPLEPHLFDRLRYTLHTFEDIYSIYISPTNKLSDMVQDELQRTIQEQFASIRGLLKAKKIPEVYLAEIQYALLAVFQGGKAPDLHYYHRHYLQTFIQALTHMAHEERNKDWPTRFVVLMIRYNFNHMGFFNRWREQVSADIQHLACPLQVYPYLVALVDVLHRSCYENDMHFDRSRRSLLEEMLAFVNEALDKARSENDHISPEQEDSIRTTMNALELNLFFNYFYKHRLLDYSSKREAAKDFSHLVQSKTGRNVSYKQLEKFERENLEPSADKVRRILKDIIASIDKDFKR